MSQIGYRILSGYYWNQLFVIVTTFNEVEKIMDWENTPRKNVEIPFKPCPCYFAGALILSFYFFLRSTLANTNSKFFVVRILLEYQL